MAPRLLHALYRAPLGAQIPDSWESTLMTTKTLQLSIWPLLLRWTSANTPIHPFCLSFTFKVRVTTTSYLKFYLSNFFSDLGGSLGLWLGVGILQVLLLFSKLFEYRASWLCLSRLDYPCMCYNILTQVFEIVCICLLPALSRVFGKNLRSTKWFI